MTGLCEHGQISYQHAFIYFNTIIKMMTFFMMIYYYFSISYVICLFSSSRYDLLIGVVDFSHKRTCRLLYWFTVIFVEKLNESISRDIVLLQQQKCLNKLFYSIIQTDHEFSFDSAACTSH